MWWTTEMGWTMRWWWTRPTHLWDWILQKMGAKLIEIYTVNSTSCVLNTKMNAHKYSQTFVLGSSPGTTFSLTIHNFLLTLPCLSKNERALKTVAVLIARCSRLDLTAHITHIWHSTGWFFLLWILQNSRPSCCQ